MLSHEETLDVLAHYHRYNVSELSTNISDKVRIGAIDRHINFNFREINEKDSVVNVNYRVNDMILLKVYSQGVLKALSL